MSEERPLTVYEELYLMSLCRTSVGSQGGWEMYVCWFKKGERRYIGYTTKKDEPDIIDPYNAEHWIYLERNKYLSEEQVREGMDSK